MTTDLPDAVYWAIGAVVLVLVALLFVGRKS